jgi:hypothetical protein
MNIFALHWKTRKAARWHVDKHVVKMILEYTQLLYTAHWALFHPHLMQCKSAIALSKAQKELEVPEYMWSAPYCETREEPAYRPCHIHHPCSVWTRECSGNYLWLAELGLELVREYRFRFKKIHACEAHIQWLYDNLPLSIRMGPRVNFAVAMDEQYKISSDPIVNYRHYYRTAKKEKGLIKYTGRHVPHWCTF